MTMSMKIISLAVTGTVVRAVLHEHGYVHGIHNLYTAPSGPSLTRSRHTRDREPTSDRTLTLTLSRSRRSSQSTHSSHDETRETEAHALRRAPQSPHLDARATSMLSRRSGSLPRAHGHARILSLNSLSWAHLSLTRRAGSLTVTAPRAGLLSMHRLSRSTLIGGAYTGRRRPAQAQARKIRPGLTDR